jgi:exodeoxyribonuclease-5
MADYFNVDLEILTLENKLDQLEVPKYENLWDRVLAFAKGFEDLYASKLSSLVVQQKKEDNLLPFKLSEDQEKAWAKILVWLSNKDQFFLLSGPAGSGKSTLMKMLTSQRKDIYFTAPTNKATKVLSRLIGKEAKTTYSQLGLRMSEEDDKLVMDYNSRPYMPEGSILVVDECSMISKKLFEFINEFSKENGVKVLFTGDSLQLPPVGEKRSKTWTCVKSNDNYAKMTKVMRHDNQILTLAVRVREYLVAKKYKYPVKDDHDGIQGVFRLDSQLSMVKQIKEFTSPKDFTDNKVIAWRNKTVNFYNTMIRDHLGLTGEYCKGDIIMMAEPVEKDNITIAHIDDEFTIDIVTETTVKVWDGQSIDIPVYRLNVSNEDQSIVLDIPREDDTLNEILTRISTRAKTETGPAKRDAWRQFWTLKRAFHKVRFAFAMTAHRSQGSTFNTCFVDTADILKNRDEREGYKCLYVAVTRASKRVVTY